MRKHLMRTAFFLIACMALMLLMPAGTAFADQDASYPVWVGATQVTDANKDDILADGGSAKFDPESSTLTLDNPQITGFYEDGFKAFIYSELDEHLTIEGTVELTGAGTSRDQGIYAPRPK